MDEIHAVRSLEGASLNAAKAVLAFEATRLAHGLEAALDAFRASIGVFGAPIISEDLLRSSDIPREAEAIADADIPHTLIEAADLKAGISAYRLFQAAGLAFSGSAARRLIEQGGAYVNSRRVEAFDTMISEKDLVNDEIVIRAGKKKFHKIKIKS